MIITDDFDIEDMGVVEDWVYDIEVEDVHNFFANNILVHNSNYVNIEPYYKQIDHGMSFIDFANDFDHRILTPFFNKLVDIYCEKYNIPNKINFKREKIITKMFVQVKKKYVCQIIANEGEVYDKPKIKITGLETKKSDLPGFCKKGLNELIDVMFDGEMPDEERMMEVVRKYQKIHKNSPIEEIAIPKGVKDYKKYAIDFSKGMIFLPSTPIHNRASINHNYMVQKYKLPYREIDDGAKIKYLFVNQTNELHQNVIAFDDEWPELFDKKFTVDRDTLFTKTFLDISQRMFDALGFRTISLKENKMGKFLKKS
jgi:DNA polymerase elongation subunit (family B)